MVHVHCTTVLQNTAFTQLFHLPSLTPCDMPKLATLVAELEARRLVENAQYPLNSIITSIPPAVCRSAVFLHRPTLDSALAAVRDIPSFQYLVDRAVKECEVYHRQGIRIVEVENIGAPYSMGPTCPWEELVVMAACCLAIRAAFPDMVIGTHVLSCNEIEALPIALLSGAYFIRSEATLFTGTRPEGPTVNSGNLARFFYLRNTLRLMRGGCAEDRAYPLIWSDLQKKHTVFPEELLDMSTWLSNVLFCKLEGVILTGPHTGSDVPEEKLARGREAVDKAESDVANITGGGSSSSYRIPLITGSGTNLEMYCKYADFIIIGTLLKKSWYWENEVDEANVAEVVRRVKGKS